MRPSPIISWNQKTRTKGVLKSMSVSETRLKKRKNANGWMSRTRSTHQLTSTTFVKFKSKKNRKRKNSNDC